MSGPPQIIEDTHLRTHREASGPKARTVQPIEPETHLLQFDE